MKSAKMHCIVLEIFSIVTIVYIFYRIGTIEQFNLGEIKEILFFLVVLWAESVLLICAILRRHWLECENRNRREQFHKIYRNCIRGYFAGLLLCTAGSVAFLYFHPTLAGVMIMFVFVLCVFGFGTISLAVKCITNEEDKT